MTITPGAGPIIRLFTDVPYIREWTISHDGQPLDFSVWSDLVFRVGTATADAAAFQIVQVATMVQGLRPIAPLSAGRVEVIINPGTLPALPTGVQRASYRGRLTGRNGAGLVVDLTPRAGLTVLIERGLGAPA